MKKIETQGEILEKAGISMNQIDPRWDVEFTNASGKLSENNTMLKNDGDGYAFTLSKNKISKTGITTFKLRYANSKNNDGKNMFLGLTT